MSPPSDNPINRSDEAVTESRPSRGPEPAVGDRPLRPAAQPEVRETGRGPEPRLTDAPRELPDGSWEWKAKDLRLSPADNATADSALAERRHAEGRDLDGNYGDRGLTPAMRKIEAGLDHAHLEGCPDHTLKTPDRFKEKLARANEKWPDLSTEELVAQIPDGIRYTFTFETDHYTDGVNQTVDKLEAQGHELTDLKNLWDGTEYKGINSRWLDSDSGQRFEVQFHTELGRQTADA